jgi:hypothetical protein
MVIEQDEKCDTLNSAREEGLQLGDRVLLCLQKRSELATWNNKQHAFHAS